MSYPYILLFILYLQAVIVEYFHIGTVIANRNVNVSCGEIQTNNVIPAIYKRIKEQKNNRWLKTTPLIIRR